MPVPRRPLLAGIRGSGGRRTVNHHVFRRPMKPTELTSWQALQRSVAMVFRAAPTELRNLAGLNLLTGVGPSVSLFLGKIVIDETSRIVATGGVENPMAVVVSHRLALAKMCDRIIVLEHGRIIESGSHDQLMALGGQYQMMFSRQASSYL